MTALHEEELEERIAKSELGSEYVRDPLMTQDIWPLTTLGYSEQECNLHSCRNIYFDKFSLPWLKRLTKLTVKAIVRERHSLGKITELICYLGQLDAFLLSKGYSSPQTFTDALLQEFIQQRSSEYRQRTLNYVAKLWADEQWLKLSYTPRQYKRTVPKIVTIPEEVLHQVYEKFDLFPAPLERLFRLQIALGCRIGEMLTMPRQCLKREGDKWFLRRWIQKQKHWRFYQIHPLVAELVQEQQRFLDTQFGNKSNFDKLFCKLSTSPREGAMAAGRFKVQPIYTPKILTRQTIHKWLQSFSEAADLKDKHGYKFKLTSHMFRRTKASIMAYCEVEDEYIAVVLGHRSLDMLPHYRQRSLERLEKESQSKGYVDMYGQVTSFKPRKRRYEKLADLLKVSTPLGECHRPTMLGDCQYRYACLSCLHHRVILEDNSQLEADRKRLQQELEQAQTLGQSRRVTEIQRLLELVKKRLQGLSELQNIKEEQLNESTEKSSDFNSFNS